MIVRSPPPIVREHEHYDETDRRRVMLNFLDEGRASVRLLVENDRVEVRLLDEPGNDLGGGRLATMDDENVPRASDIGSGGTRRGGIGSARWLWKYGRTFDHAQQDVYLGKEVTAPAI
jgi:hypothetical protein